MASGVVRRPSLLTDGQCRQLTGLSAAQFAALLAEVGPLWETDRESRLTTAKKAPRQRAFGAGRKHGLPFAGRLLLVLMYLRWNVTYRFLAAVFGSDKDTINRAVAEMTPLLAEVGITAPDGTRIGDEQALEAQLAKLTKANRAALIDGSFVPIPRPGKGGWDAQKAQYSFHRHRHVNTYQAISDDQGKLLWVTRAEPGSTHDLTAISTSSAAGPLSTSEVTVLADKAYIGIVAKMKLKRAFTPYKRFKKDNPDSPVVQTEHDFNTRLARQRVRVEHSIRTMKTNKILHGYRRNLDTLTDTIAACATLATRPA